MKDVDAKEGTVTLDHEDIPGVMMAMTMAYGVADPALLTKVKVGQAVDFRLRKDDDGNYVVMEIKAGDQKAMGSHGGEMSCCDSRKGADCGYGEMHHGMSGDGHDKMKQP